MSHAPTVSIKDSLDDLDQRLLMLAQHYNISQKKERLAEIQAEIELPTNWSAIEKMCEFEQERKQIEHILEPFYKSTQSLLELQELFELIKTDDQSLKDDLVKEIEQLQSTIKRLEFLRMFSSKLDQNNAYLDIQSGSGGTEAQDWAQMILRMYTRFCESQGFSVEMTEFSPGDVAGIKSATLYVQGLYAFGWLKTELGVHRLVRKSPFDSGNRRHTSFAAVFVAPEIDDSIEITINPADIRIDTYRASGAGGQHVNKTDSAVRITHLPTNTVAQSQSSRSQHQNKDQAMKQLRAKLYEQALLKKTQTQQQVEQNKSDISWGNQIRSYVLDQSRVKDLRTQLETSNARAVLDGELTDFIQASLKQQV